jgi:hypothetical protein
LSCWLAGVDVHTVSVFINQLDNLVGACRWCKEKDGGQRQSAPRGYQVSFGAAIH